jgi:hypothetical protein
MSKINNKILIVVLLVLAGAYLGNKYLGSKGERNFKNVLVDLDTALIDRILLTPPPSKGGEVLINKQSPGKFTVTKDNLIDEGDIGMIRSMLSAHIEMKPERLVSNSSDKWAEYEVSDSTGVNVKMYSGTKKLSEIIVGKFDFQQATRTMSTMVRISNEEQVYAVDGFLSSIFNVEFDALRDKTFLKANNDEIQLVKLDYPADSSFSLALENGEWQLDGQPADSASCVKFTNGLMFLNLRDFVNDFEPAKNELLYKLTIEGDSISTIIVDCYKLSDQYILHSTLNENAYFNPGVNNIFEKLFPPKSKFYPKPE